MNIFAHDSETLKFEDMKKIAESFMEEPALFALSEKKCDAEFVKYWFSLITNAENSSYDNGKIASQAYPHLCEELKRDPDVFIAFLNVEKDIFKDTDPIYVPNYDEFASTAVYLSELNLKHVKPERPSSRKVYDKLVGTTVKKNIWCLEYVKPEALSKLDIYDELARFAVDKWERFFDLVDPKGLSSPEVYEEIGVAAITKNPFVFRYVHRWDWRENPNIYDELARTAVKESRRNLEEVHPSKLSNLEVYYELIRIAMGDDLKFLKYVEAKWVSYIEKTKRKKLLDYIKSFRCNDITKLFSDNNCKYDKKVNKWLKDYDDHKKKQEED